MIIEKSSRIADYLEKMRKTPFQLENHNCFTLTMILTGTMMSKEFPLHLPHTFQNMKKVFERYGVRNYKDFLYTYMEEQGFHANPNRYSKFFCPCLIKVENTEVLSCALLTGYTVLTKKGVQIIKNAEIIESWVM